ncbi:MAG: NAD(P)H-binding protein [Bacteroidota bacterium]
MQGTAILFGATGAVGSQLLRQLLQEKRYDRIVVFARRSPGITHPALEINIDPLDDPERIADRIQGDHLFCCLGTTSKKAGSKEAFRKVDLDLPVALAAIASRNGVGTFVVISSIGAGESAKGFYLRTKSRMEEGVKQYSFKNLAIVRPSLLLGERNEFRFGEFIGAGLNIVFSPLLRGRLKKFRGIRTETVARAMITIANTGNGYRVYESDELQDLGS